MSTWVHDRPARLTPTRVEEIWQFLNRFSFRPRESFDQALASLERVSTLRDAHGDMQGLVGTRFSDHRVQGRRAGVLFIHWAVMAPAHRGGLTLFRLIVSEILAAKLRHPLRRLYMMFGATTFKSYLALARRGAPLWPSRRAPWPAWERALVEAAMDDLGNPNWDSGAGIVRRDGEIGFYEGVTHEAPKDLTDPDLRFYLEANPGHIKGDMLLCLVPVSLSAIGRTLAHLIGRRRGLGRPGTNAAMQP